jgi:predicted dehydrogenase
VNTNNQNSSISPTTWSRRSFIQTLGLSAGAAGLLRASASAQPAIQGFERALVTEDMHKDWQPFSDRKLRVGIAGYGVCKFGADFGFQNHPNVEVVAVTDLVPERCAGLAKACRCDKTYPSLEEMVKDDKIEAVYVATDAPSHARHCIEALKHGKHVASAVPAVFGSVEDAHKLFAAVKAARGLKYMMFETSCYHSDVYAMRRIYESGGFGKIVYTEGEYYHYMAEPIDSFKGWRIGLPPQWYPTHSNGYYIGVTGGSFTEVSCMGMPSLLPHLQPANNKYKNPFGTEIAQFRTGEGGVARMAVSWDTPGVGGEMGRLRGQKGSFYDKFEGLHPIDQKLVRPALPPGVEPGGHGGSHGYLMNEFVTSVIKDRKPLVDICMALNLTVPGIVAHKSALKNGELLKIPQFHI